MDILPPTTTRTAFDSRREHLFCLHGPAMCHLNYSSHRHWRRSHCTATYCNCNCGFRPLRSLPRFPFFKQKCCVWAILPVWDGIYAEVASRLNVSGLFALMLLVLATGGRHKKIAWALSQDKPPKVLWSRLSNGARGKTRMFSSIMSVSKENFHNLAHPSRI